MCLWYAVCPPDQVLREALPIKCIEAVFLGTLLTAGWEDLHRLPLGFKSTVNGETHRWGGREMYRWACRSLVSDAL